MNENVLHKLDLNLLKALRVLAEECHVGRAAERMQVSQSAMSHTLARLRRELEDPLFVRTARGLAPTPRTEALAERLAVLLDELTELVVSPGFEPSTARGQVTIQTNDYIAAGYLPAAVGRIHHAAPNLELMIRGEVDRVFENLEGGSSELAIGAFPGAPTRLMRRRLFEDSYCCVLRQEHAVAGALTLERYLASSHGVVSLLRRREHPVDRALQELGLAPRRVGLYAEGFLSLAYLIARNDFIGTFPRRLAEQIAGAAGLVIRDLPFAMEPLSIYLVWHERYQHTPRHQWLRTMLAEGAAGGA